MKCECGYVKSEQGCENPACLHAHWHTDATRAALVQRMEEHAAFERSINRVDYSLSFRKVTK